MKCRIPGILLFLFLVTSLASATPVFDFNSRCRQAYQNILQLKLSPGQRLLNEEKAAHPDNLIPYFLENYIDFFELFFNEDPSVYNSRKKNMDSRLSLMDTGPRNSPYFLFSKSVIHFQWSAIHVKFGNNWDAGWGFRRSFLQNKNNLKRFPDFYPAEIYDGAMQVAAGTIPDGYHWLSGLLGLSGSISGGMKQLEKFLDRQDELSRTFRNEAIFYYLYLKYYISNDKEGVFDYISKNRLDVVNNHLFTYLAANLNINNQHSEAAEKIISGRNMDDDYFQTPVWDLEMGYIRLHHLEPDAGMYFERFLRNFKGRFYVKDALQKLSWHYYLENNMQKALYYRSQILKSGSLTAEADKQAQKEAQTATWPSRLLLRVRLLNDGGYLWEALRLLQGKTVNDFETTEEKLEFSYRAGRLFDGLGNEEQAIKFYNDAIAIGENRKEYYAARACLQIGYLYEAKGEKESAINWFRKCLAMKDHDFKNSLDQRAKAGILRCKDE